jgi:hypothetical protein
MDQTLEHHSRMQATGHEPGWHFRSSPEIASIRLKFAVHPGNPEGRILRLPSSNQWALALGLAEAPLLVPELLKLIDQSCKSKLDSRLANVDPDRTFAGEA